MDDAPGVTKERQELPPAIGTRTSQLEFFKNVLREIKNDLALSEYVESIIQRAENSGEPIAIAIDISDIEDSTASAPAVVQPEHQAVLDKGEQNYIALCTLHDWLESVRHGFMYSLPPDERKKDKEEWLEEWSKVLFDFAAIEKKHVIYVQELLKNKPFSKLKTREASVDVITEKLVKKRLAIWIVKRDKLRVYWKSLEEWADVIYNWAFDNVKTDPIFIYEFKDQSQDFATLPDEEFPEIFKILEKQKKGHVVKTSDKKIAFKFDF